MGFFLLVLAVVVVGSRDVAARRFRTTSSRAASSANASAHARSEVSSRTMKKFSDPRGVCAGACPASWARVSDASERSTCRGLRASSDAHAPTPAKRRPVTVSSSAMTAMSFPGSPDAPCSPSASPDMRAARRGLSVSDRFRVEVKLREETYRRPRITGAPTPRAELPILYIEEVNAHPSGR